jgi:hypothetical protein
LCYIAVFFDIDTKKIFCFCFQLKKIPKNFKFHVTCYVVGQSSGPYTRREVAKELEVVAWIVSKTLLNVLGAIVVVVVSGKSQSDEEKED